MQALAEIGYSGWIIVEAEQDPAIADPRHYGEVGLRTLRRDAAAAGLTDGRVAVNNLIRHCHAPDANGCVLEVTPQKRGLAACGVSGQSPFRGASCERR